MLKISRTSSSLISLILVILLFVLICVGTVILPFLVKLYFETYGTPDSVLFGEVYGSVLGTLYAALIFAAAADGALFLMLREIHAGRVFVDKNISCLRAISWCCFAECLIFFVLGFSFWFSFVVAFAAAFLGTILRVVKNVMQEAAELKEENDYTI